MLTERLRSRRYPGGPLRRQQAGSVLVLIVALLVVFAAAGVGLLTQQTNSRVSALKHGLAFAAKNAADSGAGYAELICRADETALPDDSTKYIDTR